MRRCFLGLSLAALLAFTACKKDDDSSVTPPREYGEQYATEKVDIEDYLKSHYIVEVDSDMNITFAEIPEGGTQISIWDQTEYPLQNKQVNVSILDEDNYVDYTIYYLVLREGVGESPTRADNILSSYRGTTLDGTQFDYLPYPQGMSPLSGSIYAWQEILPLFKTGTYDSTPSPNPVNFQDFGAGVMFMPSGLGYYNSAAGTAPAYSSMIFTFKLYELEYIDTDGDGILSKDETESGIDILYYDTDGDGVPNFLDTDDDGDGYRTELEIRDPATGEPFENYDDIPNCDGGSVKKHLDPSCH